MVKNFEKISMVFKIIAFELKAVISVKDENNTYDRPSTC